MPGIPPGMRSLRFGRRREVISAGRDYERMQDYIVGRLSDDDSHAFEDRLLNDPGLVRELEQSLRLRDGLEQLREQGYFGKAVSRGMSPRIWLPALVAAAGAGVALFLWGFAAAGIGCLWLLPMAPHWVVVAIFLVMGWLGLIPIG